MKKILSLIVAMALLFAVFSLHVPGYAESMEGADPPPAPVENPGYSGIEQQNPTPPADTPVDPTPTPPADTPVVPVDPVIPIDPINPVIPTDPTVPTVPAYTGMPVITKHPTSETVKDGGYAEFVARADNCQKIEWYVSNGRTGAEFLVWDAPNRFPGLSVTGIEGERLGLNNIPYMMDGWRVRAKFIGSDGEVYSNYADIYVKAAELKVPTISQQPRSVSLKENEAVNLEVSAASADAGTRLTYQWYMNTTDSNTGGKVIYSATNASYIPDYIPGTTYYYCVIRSTDGNTTSQPSKTQCAAVIYPRAVPETTVPPTTEAPTAAATVPTAPATTEPQTPVWAEATQDTASAPEMTTLAPTRGISLMVILVAAIVVIILLGILATVLILRFYPRDEEEDDDKENEVDFIPPAPRKKAKAQPADDLSDLNALLSTKEPEWDDLSDLGDLSIYFDDDK